MKKYSSIYPMIFGIICLIAGLIVQQPGIVIVFGIIPILLSILFIHSDRKAKKKGLESNTEMLNRVYQERKQSPFPQPSVSAPKTYLCARCKKELTDSQTEWIGNHRFCVDCAASTKKSTIKMHLETEAKDAAYQAYMDYARGSDTPEEAYTKRGFVQNKDGTWVYGKIAVKDKAGNEMPNTPKIQENTVSASSKKEAISTLRKKIIDQIAKAPATHYELASLLWEDASRCFPTSYSFNWDGAWFKLDLETMGLYADVSTYPNQFGASRDDRYKLTAYEFHQKAIEFQMAKELQCMETEADWMALLDDSLKSAIAQAQNALADRHEKEKHAEQIANAIVIPDHFAKKTPTMEFCEIVLELSQRYGSSCVYLTQKSEKYLLRYGYSARYSSATSGCQRELSAMEAAWVEQQVRNCINNTDSSTWQSLPGGDRMSVKIVANKKPNIELHNTTPQNKYYDLMHLLHTLAKYGSLSKSEKKNML